MIQAIQQENVQAAAGKIGGRPVPTGQDFELPITLKGRLEKASEFEEIIVRRSDDGSIVRIKDVARVELSSENFESASYIDGKPAGGILIYQYADANALEIIHTVREEMDQLKTSFPEGLDYTIVYNTTDYVRREHQGGRAHAGRVVRPGHDRRVRLPPGRSARRSSRCWRSRSRWSPRSR